MGALSDFAAAGMQNLTLRGESFASPATVYLGWFTSPPMPDGTADQVTGGGHTRQAITFGAAVGGTIDQDTPVVWSTFHADTDHMLAGWGIWDAVSGGNLIAYGRIPSTLVRAGASFSVTSISVASDDRAMSDVLANAWLDHLLGGVAYSPPSTVWLGHFTETPTATDPGTEVVDDGYFRRAADWTTAATGLSALDNTPTWNPLANEDQTLTGWALLDDETAGDVLWFYAWPTEIAYTGGDTIEMPAGSITLRAA